MTQNTGNIYYTMDELQSALDQLAMIIKNHGKVYLPLYRVLHEERDRRLNNKNILDLALDHANRIEQQQPKTI